MKTFPFEMYHIAFGKCTVASESDVENCIRNGFLYDPPEKTNSSFIKSKIASLKADITQLEINLIHAEEEEKLAEAIKKDSEHAESDEEETEGTEK